MSHEQESTVAVPGVTIQDFASDWGRQESPGFYFNAMDKANQLLGEIRHAVRDGDLKIFDPFLGRERSFRESDSPALDRGRIKVLPSSINVWLRSIGMAPMPAAEQPPRADPKPAPGLGAVEVSSEPPEQEAASAPADRQRRDDIQIEIDDIVAELERQAKRVTPAEVMAVLRGRAGRQDSCVTEIAGEGVLWRRGSNGKQEKLSFVALKGRLRRGRRR